jgi:tetratricopeptide (TPR) repeat protein
MLPAVALSAGVAASSIGRLVLRGKSMLFEQAIAVLLTVIAIIFAISSQEKIFFSLNSNEVAREVYGLNPFPETLEIAKYIKEHTNKDEKIAVIGSEPQIYFYADRHSATGYIYTYALMENHDFAGTMQEEMIREVESADPEFVVFANVRSSWLPRPGSKQLLFEWFSRYINRFDRVGVVDLISDDSIVYMWDEDSIGYRPLSDIWISVHRKKGKARLERAAEKRTPSSENAAGLNKLGMRHGKTGDIDRAIECFKKAAEIDPSYAESYNNLGFAYYMKKDYEQAEKYFRKTLEIDPSHKKARANLNQIQTLRPERAQ